MESVPHKEFVAAEECAAHESLVRLVKDCQRSSEAARHAWRLLCDADGAGVRDPSKHHVAFLQLGLAALQAAMAKPPEAAGDGQASLLSMPELVPVESREAALGSDQLRLLMPASEAGIMNEVVSTNVYGFLPGRNCVLREGDVVLDIGAHVGVAAALARRTKDVRVHCVEPHPVTFSILARNMLAESEHVKLINKGIAECAGSRPLYIHMGTGSPSRLFFSSLFDTRRHNDAAIAVECAPLQELVDDCEPTVLKIDAEGAERYLTTVDEFRRVRLIVAEWDWAHNRHRDEWLSVESHLGEHGFVVEVRGRMPAFDDEGLADLCDKNGKKRGNTGMIFAATRQLTGPSTKRQRRSLVLPDFVGCPVGALVCDKTQLRHVFDACRASALVQPKGAVPIGEQMAVHLTLEGAARMCADRAPVELQALLDKGAAEFVPGLRKGAASQTYRGSATAPPRSSAEASTFTFIDLFAGIGGFRRGLEAVGGRCVFASEIDTDCQETYALNFGGAHLFGDITAIDTEEFPSHDILTAGFPCQPFSRRGGRGGFDDGRGGLFLEIPRVLRARRPAGFLLENVWNLQYIDGGQWDKDEKKCVLGSAYTFIMQSLEKCGYSVVSKVINAKGWVPQDRKRIYLVGFRQDLAARAAAAFQWPEPPGGGHLRDVLEQPTSADAIDCELTESQWAAVQRSSTWQSGGPNFRFADLAGLATTLTASYKASFANVAQLVAPRGDAGCRPRFFTPRECARIMGFGEQHVIGNPNSPNRAYHQLGNAVCPPLVEAIARSLVTSLGLAAGSGPTDFTIAVDDVPPAFAEDLTIPGAQPSLRAQLEAFTIEQLASRLEALGVAVRQPSTEEFVSGFKAQRKRELLDELCAEYAREAAPPREVLRSAGIEVPQVAAAELLSALSIMDWKENVRPGVDASGYVVLKRPYELSTAPRWRDSDPRAVRRRVWELSEALLQSVSAKAAAFAFTAIAVSRNFRGSPHIDKNDRSVQYAMSLGDFSEGGGELCVEESPFVVRAFNTRGRLVCIDGRFPHWVSGYVGERYSVIFYRSAGDEDPVSHAVHEV